MRWGSTLTNARVLPQKSPPNYTDELTRAQTKECPRDARNADKHIQRIHGLRDIRGDAIRKDDEEVDEDFRGDYRRGEEVDGYGDDDQEG